MSKSPLKFGAFSAISGMGGNALTNAANLINKKAVGARVKKLENQVGVLMKDKQQSMDPVEMGTQEPMYETAVQGDVADNVIQSNPTNFDPNTVEAASGMFGEEMPNSFDRNMGQKLY
jgi:hypothetical protein